MAVCCRFRDPRSSRRLALRVEGGVMEIHNITQDDLEKLYQYFKERIIDDLRVTSSELLGPAYLFDTSTEDQVTK